DGFELAELMRGTERTRHIPIIFVTAGAWERNRLFRGYDAGAVDFLFKPIDPHILRHKVRTFVALYRQRVSIREQVRALERSEAEARALKDELAATLRLNETFVAAVSHDLKNPLNAVLMATELLLAGGPTPETRRIVERARNSSRRMLNMIEQLFDLSRARLAGGIPLVLRENTDLSRIAEQVRLELNLVNADCPVSLHVIGDPCGTWDDVRLERLISNLLGNAVRHGVRGAPIEMSIDGSAPDVVRFVVTNSGQIPPEILPRLFEPFSEKEPSRRRGDGLGLGLYIVAQIVSAHAGEIDVRSGDGTTTFTVSLPRCAPRTTPRLNEPALLDLSPDSEPGSRR
ncbi:MAG TPA: hybrid sensor histidine kinase/response regulator, partial [Polyangiaceae bacterium]|nr:hybrid sensor histidine kinase/response regulator [Polyangiaceae bacterium]